MVAITTLRHNNINAAQQSVHLTLGILRDLQAFFYLWVYTALKPCPRPPQRG
jgi:hypothetical protein